MLVPKKIRVSSIELSSVSSIEKLSFLWSASVLESYLVYGHSMWTISTLIQTKTIFKFTNSCDVVLSDGIVLGRMLRSLNPEIKELISIPEFCAHLIRKSTELTLILYGSDYETNLKACQSCLMHNKSIEVLGCDGYSNENHIQKITNLVKSSKYDKTIILIGLPSPLKESVAQELKDENVGSTIIPCGGVLDILGKKRKATPMLIKKSGLTTLYRLLQNPRFVCRYLQEYLFFFLCVIPLFLFLKCFKTKNEQ